MTGDELARLRRRLAASYAAVSLVVLLVLAVLVVIEARDQRREQQDRLVERTALSADGFAYPEGEPSHLVVDRQPDGYFGPARRPGAPVAVVDPGGRIVGGPRDLLDAAAARRAYARVRNGGRLQLVTDETGGERVRVATSPVEGTDGVLAAIVAVEPLAAVTDDLLPTGLRVAAATLALWLLTVAAGWLLAGRALRPAAAVARREEAFLADAAHELRTPVAVIRARAEQALRELGPSPPADAPVGALQAIERAAERASGTIADMLELARLDARRGRFEREPLRLDLLLEQLVEEYHETAAKAGAELRLEVAGEAVVLADERLLGRAIANLVENAIRYGAVGGAIDVGLTLGDGVALVDVHDHGPGVPPAQRAAIFDRFHRASGTAGGSGLGLPIARLVAESHDGGLELLPAAEDRPGARFRLRVPLAAAPASD
ncbi:sensor histidine kinase [Patulibacter defluvii]|uniref:sensor histidine kinase n=1 Tax=Patulibacter defluvii TaxID=3095358 RepID=UPI002A748963|nr:HAMP domain-containing sensor histidine kinase [Patulibacter sp. DM4]